MTTKTAPKGTKAKTTKTIVSTIDEVALQRRTDARPALDAYLTAEDRADKASKKKATAKIDLMAVTEHGDLVTASDGRSRMIVNMHEATNQHAKVVGLLAAQFNVSEADLKKLYAKTKGSKHVQEAKKV